MKILEILQNLLFPIKCIFCNLKDIAICDKCFSEIKTEISLTEKHLGIYSYHNDKIRTILKDVKYNNNIILLRKFSHKTAEEFLKLLKISGTFYDQIILIPIPLSANDLRMYNHAHEFAKEFKFFLNEKIKSEIILFNLLIKNNQIKQANLESKEERLINLQNKFEINRKELKKLKYKIKSENIIFIIVDDVKTTGSTLKSAENVLKENLTSLNLSSPFIFHLTLAH